MRLHSLGQLRLEGIEERIELFAVETHDPPMPAASPFTPAGSLSGHRTNRPSLSCLSLICQATPQTSISASASPRT